MKSDRDDQAELHNMPFSAWLLLICKEYKIHVHAVEFLSFEQQVKSSSAKKNVCLHVVINDINAVQLNKFAYRQKKPVTPLNLHRDELQREDTQLAADDLCKLASSKYGT